MAQRRRKRGDSDDFSSVSVDRPMSDGANPLRFVVASSLSEIAADAWDALCGVENNPFLEYSFLRQLEISRCVGPESGWTPRYVLVYLGQRLVGAVPSFMKAHSWGEYIFDFSWADVSENILQIQYYPKVVVAVPFTPATGKRILLAHDSGINPALLIQVMKIIAMKWNASGVHFLYCEKSEAELMATQGMHRRETHQYHWRNHGYSNFDDFLKHLRKSARRDICRERRRVAEAGITTRIVRGAELTPDLCSQLYEFYVSTVNSKGFSMAYLTRDFFQALRTNLAHRVVVAIAEDHHRSPSVVGAALAFEKGEKLFGRYWGTSVQVDCLHFELCYYKLTEYAIASGKAIYEAGAQGEHKIRRGFLPVITHSAHLAFNSQLHHFVGQFVQQERRQLEEVQMPMLRSFTPFKRDDDATATAVTE